MPTTDRDAQASTVSARPTSSAAMGKQTVVLKTLVSDEFDEQFRRFARERGYGSTSDCLREIAICAVLGSDYLADLHRSRIESLGRNLSKIGTPA